MPSGTALRGCRVVPGACARGLGPEVSKSRNCSADVGHGDRSGVTLRLLADSVDFGERPVGQALRVELERCRVVLVEALEQGFRSQDLVTLCRFLDARRLVHLVAQGRDLEAAVACGLAYVQARAPGGGPLEPAFLDLERKAFVRQRGR